MYILHGHLLRSPHCTHMLSHSCYPTGKHCRGSAIDRVLSLKCYHQNAIIGTLEHRRWASMLAIMIICYGHAHTYISLTPLSLCSALLGLPLFWLKCSSCMLFRVIENIQHTVNTDISLQLFSHIYIL